MEDAHANTQGGVLEKAQLSEGKHPEVRDVRCRTRRPTKRGGREDPSPPCAGSHTLAPHLEGKVRTGRRQITHRNRDSHTPTAALGRGASLGPLDEAPLQRTEQGGGAQGTQKAAPA